MKQISSLYSLDFNFVKLVLYVTVSLKHLPQWQFLPVHDQLSRTTSKSERVKIEWVTLFWLLCIYNIYAAMPYLLVLVVD